MARTTNDLFGGSLKESDVHIVLADMDDGFKAQPDSKLLVPDKPAEDILEDIGNNYNRDYNKEDIMHQLKTGFNSEESREMYWALMREKRDKEIKRGFGSALFCSILMIITSALMIFGGVYHYLHIAITMLLSICLIIAFKGAKFIGTLLCIGNSGWTLYQAWLLYQAGKLFTTGQEHNIPTICMLIAVIIWVIIFIRMSTSKSMDAYYSQTKQQEENFIKSNRMNM